MDAIAQISRLLPAYGSYRTGSRSFSDTRGVRASKVRPRCTPSACTCNGDDFKGIPIYGGRDSRRLCTPTGYLLVHFATEFGNMPVMATSAIGLRYGKKDFEAANSVPCAFRRDDKLR